MSNTSWQEVTGAYRNRIEHALNVRKHALDLVEHPASGEDPSKYHDGLYNEITVLERQLDRLKKNEFRIAVVGLEKAGKSTFINAWLNYDILPNDQTRCTFTTTQLYSVATKQEQALIVIPKTHEQFAQMKAELQEKANQKDETGKRATADLQTIHTHQSQLSSVIKEGPQKIRFTSIGEIQGQLKKYVADQRYAHAVAEVQIHVAELASAEGVVFFDLPGLNSGLGKHLDESREMLEDCDAVICVQRAKQPSLVESEQRLIRFVEKGDSRVGAGGKLFVFLGQIDVLGSRKALDESLYEAAKDWKSRTGLNEDRIIPGTAAGHLLLQGSAGERLRVHVSKDNVENTLRDFFKGEDPKAHTGIERMRRRINDYLQYERIESLRKRVDHPTSAIMHASKQVHKSVSARFPEDPDEAARLTRRSGNELFNKWWKGEWNRTRAKLTDYYNDHFAPAKGGEIAMVAELKEEYITLVKEGLKALPTRQPEARTTFFKSDSIHTFDSASVNEKWREVLYDECMTLLDEIANQFSTGLMMQAEKFVDEMSGWLWMNSPNQSRVRQELIPDRSAYQENLKSALRALFLRFARPVATLLIRGPVDSERRSNLARSIGADIELIDNYYTGDEPALSSLKKFVNHGRNLLEDSKLRKQVLGKVNPVLPILAEGLAAVVEDVMAQLPEKNQKKGTEVIKEVEGDLLAFEYYLTHGIFEAAGFHAFCTQEIARLRDRFREEDAIWQAAVRSEWEAGNPALMNALPPALRDQDKFSQVIAEHLRQLGEALREAQRVGL